jgi:cell division protein FtsI (penicillin-binding protein 3)
MMSKDSKRIRLRVLLVAVFFNLFFIAIGLKAAYLQLYKGPWLSEMAADQYEHSIKTSGQRGTIYDRNLTEMAVSIKVTSIAAYPNQITNRADVAQRLAGVLGLDRRSLERNLASKRSFIWVKRQATPREVERTKRLKLAGVGFVPEYNRFYPNKTLAAQVIGFTGIDGDGLEGIEYSYDSYLKGSEVQLTLLRDALGQQFVAPGEATPDFDGKNVILTIDRTIQYISEKALEDAVQRYAAKSGIAIVMAPNSGAVLAMAHYPFFNPNAFKDFNRNNWRNRAITDPVEPGSTMKIFSAVAAVESGGSSPNTIFFCENGAYRIGGRVIHDLGSYGWLSLQQIIKYSSNIGAIKISEMLGPERLYNTLHDFGFGTKTGIDCPGETTGSMNHYSQWKPIDTGVIAFGHGIAVSPIQLITAVSAIANKGRLMRPHLVQAISDQNGRVEYTFEPNKVRQAVTEEAAATVSGIMETVISRGGTGTRAALEGYSVCGKTGTAQKINEEGAYSEDAFIASFVGYAPANDPSISVLVIINEPQTEYYGGIVAAPVFRSIAQQTLNYLNIPPETKAQQLAVSRVKGGKS